MKPSVGLGIIWAEAEPGLGMCLSGTCAWDEAAPGMKLRACAEAEGIGSICLAATRRGMSGRQIEETPVAKVR